jgi:hypothetical protein
LKTHPTFTKFRVTAGGWQKDLLMRIDLRKVAKLISQQEICAYLKAIQAPAHEIQESDFTFLEPSQPKEEQFLLLMEKGN